MKRIDVVWDTYKADSLKAKTREKRGRRLRQKVSGPDLMPKNWQMSLRVNEKKIECFDFLHLKFLQSPAEDLKNCSS